MSEQVPFELRAIDADVAGELLGCTARTVLEKHACREEFPERVSLRPATWAPRRPVVSQFEIARS